MSDWRSLGCINAPTPDSVFENILHRRINWTEHANELASPEAIDLMNKLMTINPQERLGANVNERFPNGGAEIRSHLWFSDINSGSSPTQSHQSVGPLSSEKLADVPRLTTSEQGTPAEETPAEAEEAPVAEILTEEAMVDNLPVEEATEEAVVDELVETFLPSTRY
jgi:serine/threonine protein kinase